MCVGGGSELNVPKTDKTMDKNNDFKILRENKHK